MSKFKFYTCPICGYDNVGNVAYNDERGVVEKYIHCSRCNYYYEYAYGHYVEYFAGHEFAWSYHTKGNEFANLCRKMKRAQFMARRNWRKGLKDKFKIAYDDLG